MQLLLQFNGSTAKTLMEQLLKFHLPNDKILGEVAKEAVVASEEDEVEAAGEEVAVVVEAEGVDLKVLTTVMETGDVQTPIVETPTFLGGRIVIDVMKRNPAAVAVEVLQAEGEAAVLQAVEAVAAVAGEVEEEEVAGVAAGVIEEVVDAAVAETVIVAVMEAVAVVEDGTVTAVMVGAL